MILDHATSKTVPHGKVVALLNAARYNNVQPGMDLPYMPIPATTLTEAITHLRRSAYLLIEGGRIDYALGSFVLTVRGSRTGVVITWQEVAHLLRANYAKTPRATCRELPEGDRPTLPEPLRFPLPGYCLIAPGEAGDLVDCVSPEVWEPALLDTDKLTGQEKLIGVYCIAGLSAYVWYSEDLLDDGGVSKGGFLAQPCCFTERDNLPIDLVFLK